MFCQKNGKGGLLAICWINRWKTLIIIAAPKCQILLTMRQMKTFGCARVTNSDTRPLFTVKSAKQNCLATGQSSIGNCKFWSVQCFVSIYVIKPLRMFQSFIRDSLLSNRAYKLGDWSRSFHKTRRTRLRGQQSREKVMVLFAINPL